MALFGSLPPYALTVAVQRPMYAALHEVRAALEAEGFTLLAEVQPAAEGLYHQILFTHAQLQQAMLVEEPNIGALLPWCAAAMKLAPQHIHLALQDPMVLAAHTKNKPIQQLCQQAQFALRRVVDRLMLGAPIVA